MAGRAAGLSGELAGGAPGGARGCRTPLADRRDATARACTLTHHVVRVDGRVVSRAELRVLGGTAQVEDMVTEPAHRRRGHASAVTAHAVAAARAAGCDVVYLLAEATGRPQHLYRRLGFTDAGSVWGFATEE